MLRGSGSDPFFWQLIRNAGLEIHRRLNRPGRNASELFVRGVVVVVVMGIFALLISAAVINLSQYAYGWIATLLLLFACISVMPYIGAMRRISKNLAAGSVQKAAIELKPFFPAMPEQQDMHGLIRETLGIAAVRLNQYLVGPALFFLLFGIPGLVIYVTFSALHDAFGAQDIFFGGMIRAIDKLLNFVPAFVTVALISAAALFVSKSSPAGSLREAFRQKRYRLWVTGALAGALNITLGGAGGWIGAKESSARATPEDLKRGAMLYFVVFLISIIALSLSIMALYNFS